MVARKSRFTAAVLSCQGAPAWGRRRVSASFSGRGCSGRRLIECRRRRMIMSPRQRTCHGRREVRQRAGLEHSGSRTAGGADGGAAERPAGAGSNRLGRGGAAVPAAGGAAGGPGGRGG